jgi:hypothetical protein
MVVRAVHILQMLSIGLHDGSIGLSVGIYTLMRLLLVPMPINEYGQRIASL